LRSEQYPLFLSECQRYAISTTFNC